VQGHPRHCIEHGSGSTPLQDFTKTIYRREIVHQDGFQLRYVRRGFIVKDATRKQEVPSKATTRKKGSARVRTWVADRWHVITESGPSAPVIAANEN
jgi:hypothetical protein